MKLRSLIVAFAMVAAGSAFPQTSTTSPLPAPRPAVDGGSPLPGANSFTETQAKEKLIAEGYSAVTNLKKDEQGVWRGTATHAGANKSVAVDYRGNISTK